MTNTASPGSFYNQNAVTYTDANPAGPADTPVANTPTGAPSSFYRGTGVQSGVPQVLTGAPPFTAIPHNFLTGISPLAVWNYAQPAFTDISGTATDAQLPSNIQASRIVNGMVNVVSFGAVIDGVTDNATVVQNAINSLAGPGMVMFPVGTCVVNTGLTLPTGVVLCGVGNPLLTTAASCISSGNADIPVVNMSGGSNGLQNLSIIGGGFQGANTFPANPAVLISSSDCYITFCKLTGGVFALQNTVGDCTIFDSKIDASYGNSAWSSVGGFYSLRNKINRSWNAFKPANGTTFANRANTTSYATGAVVKHVGASCLLVCITGGITAGAEPALTAANGNYGTAIPDGAAVWHLQAPNTYAGIHITNGGICFDAFSDHSGAHSSGIEIDGTTGQVTIAYGDFDSNINNGVYIHGTSSDVKVIGCEISNVIDPAGTGVMIAGSTAGLITVKDNTIFSVPYGVQNQSGSGNAIDDNVISGITIAGVVNTTSNFTNHRNKFNSTVWGTVLLGVQVGAGAYDRYSITANDFSGCTTAVTDGGTGLNKRVETGLGPMPLTSLAAQANKTFLGNVSGGSAAPVALTPAQVCGQLGLRQTSGPFNPVGTASTTRVMMGCAVSVTPSVTGTLMLLVTASAANNTAGDGTSTRVMYGTGTAPVNGVAETGTIGTQACNTTSSTAAGQEAVALGQLITGLTPGTVYWFDVSIKANTGGTATDSNIQFTFVEL